MGETVAPMLAVSDPVAAIDFYQRAFGARLQWRTGQPAEAAGLQVADAEFFLAREHPTNPRSPNSVGFTTGRIELFVDDPVAAQTRAVSAGAEPSSPVLEREQELASGRTLRMIQGGVTDPFGHVRLIGKFLD